MLEHRTNACGEYLLETASIKSISERVWRVTLTGQMVAGKVYVEDFHDLELALTLLHSFMKNRIVVKDFI